MLTRLSRHDNTIASIEIHCYAVANTFHAHCQHNHNLLCRCPFVGNRFRYVSKSPSSPFLWQLVVHSAYQAFFGLSWSFWAILGLLLRLVLQGFLQVVAQDTVPWPACFTVLSNSCSCLIIFFAFFLSLTFLSGSATRYSTCICWLCTHGIFLVSSFGWSCCSHSLMSSHIKIVHLL